MVHNGKSSTSLVADGCNHFEERVPGTTPFDEKRERRLGPGIKSANGFAKPKNHLPGTKLALLD